MPWGEAPLSGPDPGTGAGHRPLVVVTRPRSRAAGIIEALEGRGIGTILFPTIEIVGPDDPAPLARAADDAAAFDWIVFTSAAGVRAFARVLGERRDGRTRLDGGPALAAVGPSTAATVRDLLGRDADVVPQAEYSAAGLVEALGSSADLRDRTVLLPVAEAARDTLAAGLRELGARVRRVVAYRTVAPRPEAVRTLRRALAEGRVDLLTFTSPSTAENFLKAVGERALDVPVAVIGSVTGAAAEELGYRVAVVAPEQTVDGLVRAVVEYLDGGDVAVARGPDR